ncbi:MAG: hypothetical protein GW946_00465 [Candidatus Pacebacteria bacterium]|nr:hypothetical protein [Candidatus Paceibacterota bacterium]PIR59948.1 MAG: hypothetical protein COU67_04160 [Candidatus Pacebacteria bacterium CG10_big_fil_rev_8_21_14_0_10_44_54]
MRNATDVQFDLFIKLREIKQAAAVLEQIGSLPTKQREAWAKEYGEMVHDAFEGFIDDSNSVLRDVSFDPSTMKLSQDLILSLRDTLATVQHIVAVDKKPLRS